MIIIPTYAKILGKNYGNIGDKNSSGILETEVSQKY
jgi:hypothetical protein